MPKKRAQKSPTTKSYRVLNGFDYPASQAIRERGISNTPKAEQGEWVNQEVGDKITAPPSDVLKTCMRRGWLELITKGATDDA